MTAILFDLDNTLYDQHRARKEGLRRLKEVYDIFSNVKNEELIYAFHEAEKRALDDYRDGESISEVRLKRAASFLTELEIDPSYSEKVNEKFLELYPSVSAPVDGCKKLLRSLNKNYDLGVISNGTKEVQNRKLKAIGLDGFFDCTVFSEEIGIRKPDPRIFNLALDEVDEEPEKCLFIGDSFGPDVVGASKAGLYSCWFNPDGKEIPEGEHQPDKEIRNLEELKELLELKR